MKAIRTQNPFAAALIAALALTTTTLRAQEYATATKATAEQVGKQAAATGEVGLAQQLQNPIASLNLVPIQSNFDFGAGPTDDGFQYKANVQPVLPFALNENWNIISRTILPVVYQDDIIGPSSQSGLADTLQSLFFSPQKPTSGGWIWGVGPVFQLPTATDELLGEEKWGIGPTAVVLKQRGGWTYGALVNHVWSVAGEDDRADVNRSFLQPFLAYTTERQTTFTLNSESAYDWEHHQWTAPLNALVSQLVLIGGKPIQFQFGGRYYADAPSGGPDWGLRFTVTFIFPRK